MNSGGSCLSSPHLQVQGGPFPVLLPFLSELYFIFRYPQITLDALGSACLQVVGRTGAEQQATDLTPGKAPWQTRNSPTHVPHSCNRKQDPSPEPLSTLTQWKEKRTPRSMKHVLHWEQKQPRGTSERGPDNWDHLQPMWVDFAQGALSIIQLFWGQKYDQMIPGAEEGKARGQKQAGTTLRGAKQLGWARVAPCRARRDIHPQAGPSSPSTCPTTTLANQPGPNSPLCLAASG